MSGSGFERERRSNADLWFIVTSGKRRKHKHHHHHHHHEGDRKRRRIKQLMYQIPVRRNFLDRDYLIYAGYRVQPQHSTAQILRTDIGVDFIEDQPRRRAYTDGGIPLVRPRPRGSPKVSNIQYGDGGPRKRNIGRERSCSSWQRGDRVILTDTNEMVQILTRGLRGRELVVEIKYSDKSEFPGLVVELPLLELMTTGNLVQEGTGTCGPVKVDVKTMTNRLSSPQPYYRKYSKPSVGNGHNGLLQSCFARSQSEDTTDARSSDTPRFRPLTNPWYSTSPKKDFHLSMTKLLNDPEEFQRKRLFFENFYIATERGLKPKPYGAPVFTHLDSDAGDDDDEVQDRSQRQIDIYGEQRNDCPFPEQPSFISEGDTENELYVTCVAYMTMNQGIEEEEEKDQVDEILGREGKRGIDDQNQLGSEALDEDIGREVEGNELENDQVETKDSPRILAIIVEPAGMENKKIEIGAGEVPFQDEFESETDGGKLAAFETEEAAFETEEQAFETAEAAFETLEAAFETLEAAFETEEAAFETEAGTFESEEENLAAFEADEAAFEEEIRKATGEAKIGNLAEGTGDEEEFGTRPESTIDAGTGTVEQIEDESSQQEFEMEEAPRENDPTILEKQAPMAIIPPSSTSIEIPVAAVFPKRFSEVRSPSPIQEEEGEDLENDDTQEGEVIHNHPVKVGEAKDGQDYGEKTEEGQQLETKGPDVTHNVTYTKE